MYYKQSTTIILHCLCVFGNIEANAQNLSGIRKTDTMFIVATIKNKYLVPIQVPTSPITVDYYSKHLGFFCKEEVKMQKTALPFSFRVGSFEDCNKLEQKPGYR